MDQQSDNGLNYAALEEPSSAVALPFSPSSISRLTQQYLRESPDVDWAEV
jgi:hypothetical protein